MRFTSCIDDIARASPPTAFEFAREHIDPKWIEGTLAATGKATIRRRKLPAELVIWLVIGMALFRDRSIRAVVSHLGLAIEPGRSERRGTVVPAAVAQARSRLGPEPLRTLFQVTADAWGAAAAERDQWHGLSVHAVDGTTLCVQDTAENDAYFGRTTSGRGQSGYPQVRIVALSLPRSHLLTGLAIGPYATSEAELAKDLWDKIPNKSITLLDRGFLAYGTLWRLTSRGTERHWLTRAKSNTRWTKVAGTDGDGIVEMALSPESRLADPELPETMFVRAVRYQRKGFRPQVLLTSLIDPAVYSADAIIELYHERWEIELGFDEKKTHMLERREALRSKTSDGVLQELWGIAIAYNLVRLMMAEVAKKAGVAPRRISFWNALLAVRSFALWAWDVAPGTIPNFIQTLERDLGLLILPERKSRSNPREVKVKMSKFRKKSPRSQPKVLK